MQINLPDVVAEVSAAFARYEKALVTNDTVVLDELFRTADETVRFGIAENLFGIEAIRAFRSQRPAINLAREVIRTNITTYGRDFATTAITFHRESAPGKVGRQMQSWVRFPEGWRIVAAHVSVIPTPADERQ
ncbi:oxalurate catabolism protein HpxZ [Bradyrhizobium sp. LHD-71]|jgi:hypothetical protein|uniref:oxalurate catabolism protein HpxZ n=1 Tax=Bradyrhizobium sp. LHD-71 TaxID=3072141 RepID=UPI00280F6F54|nr:oxalurate catabolism protein HpxZ [Bradyrhizobium sp. LHD-71]MDQ8732108.1 oxalurate catabolism protein HpxZ [Bradyrhizobium sp. LHD-71]